MSQWIKWGDFPLVSLAVLVIAVSFLVFSTSWLSVAIFLLLCVRAFWVYPIRQHKRFYIFLTLFLVWFGGQWLWSRQQDQQPLEVVESLTIQIDTLSVNGDQLSFQATSQGRLLQVYYQLQSEEEKKAFQQLTTPTTLAVEASLSEATAQRNFSGFDYQAYLDNQGIYQTVTIERIIGQGRASSWNPLDWLRTVRRKALIYIKNTFPAPMSHYISGLLFGDLDSDFDQMSDLYTSLGIIHLFALSGMQVGFFIEIFRKILLRLGLPQETVDLLQYPFSLVYAGLTGFSISVIRSLIQKLLTSLGLKKLENLAVTALICFLLVPRFLLSAGGVLSFSYALILTVLDLGEFSGWRETVIQSLALSLGILPLLIYYFSSFQPLSILLTLVFSILFDSLLLPGLTLIFALSPLVPITQVNGLFLLLEKVIVWISGLVTRPLVFGRPGILVLLALLICLMLLHDYFQHKRLRYSFAVAILLLLAVTKHPLQNEITMVDVGQGDSIFLRDVRGRSVLIDVGGKVSFGSEEVWQEGTSTANAERTLIPYLYSRGVSRIDTLVLTHTDTDHIGDLEVVAAAIDIGEIWVTPGSLTNPDFVERLEKLDIPVHVAAVGEALPIFDSGLQVLYPNQTGDGGNDDSLVLYGNLQGTRFLFTGDLEENGESELLNAYPDLMVDVLKAGHHGSKGSSSPDFLAQLDAKIALVSAGANNRYQHPHQETLNRFENEDMTVFRTDQQGAIRFTGFRTWEIETVR